LTFTISISTRRTFAPLTLYTWMFERCTLKISQVTFYDTFYLLINCFVWDQHKAFHWMVIRRWLKKWYSLFELCTLKISHVTLWGMFYILINLLIWDQNKANLSAQFSFIQKIIA